MSGKKPKVSVLMSVFNGEKYLGEAVESILQQTLEDFEFIVINDASTDGSLKILESYRDPRTKIIINEKNLGLTQSLNVGMDQCQGEYIARMDCDDISLGHRLKKQVEFMDKHPNISICGSWVKSFGDVWGRILKYPEGPKDNRCRLLFHSTLAHPAVMMRKEALIQFNLRYNPLYKRAQDYDLWVRASEQLEISNIQEALLLHRIHLEQVSIVNGADQQDTAYAVRKYQLDRLVKDYSQEEMEIHQKICNRNEEATREFVLQAEAWLKKLLSANQDLQYPEPEFSKTIGYMWYVVCTTSAKLGIWVFRKYFSSELHRSASVNLVNMTKFFIKMVIRKN